jgi:formylmethanofuran dehydrogenase subunit D
MPEGKLILITGRSTKQGTGISIGKESAEYREATTFLELSPADMARLGLHDGDAVRLRTRHGEATAQCRSENVPEGLAYMAFGPATSQLIGGETHASGMPDTKGFEVELERVPA